MKFTEFKIWYKNYSSKNTMEDDDKEICESAIREIEILPYWRREKYWRDELKEYITINILNKVKLEEG